MPGLGRYPCTTCNYVASNRRMLARHAVLIHSVKSFKCPLCPFMTRYAANWYRHKRDQHGLTKFTTCEVCGFFASNTEELARHKESEHIDLLGLSKYEDKYAKERLKVGVDPETELLPSGDASAICEAILEEGAEFEEPIILNGNFTESDDFNSSGELPVDDSITFSLPLNGGLLESDYAELKNSETTLEGSNNITTTPLADESTKLKPLRIRRSYCCNQCGLLTSDPRQFLYHSRDIHGERISVHECKWCIYASKHVQKLQRHCNLVHRQQVEEEKKLQKEREEEEARLRKIREEEEARLRKIREEEEERLRKQREEEEERLRKQREAEENELRKQQEIREIELRKQYEARQSELRKQLEANEEKDGISTPLFKEVYTKKYNAVIFKCDVCSYQTRNKVLMSHHEKTVHKKKTYRCLKCGYGTNEKSRYTKHIKYHNLPKIRCEFCFFQTAYKWNMDRHMRNHMTGAEGAYNCILCNFTTPSKQSLKLHATNHHNVTVESNSNQQEMMAFNEEQDSFSESQWDDINIYEDEMMLEENNISMMEAYPANKLSKENSWNKQGVKKSLQCSQCEYKATWPFELRKHEENHRSNKRHQCPLCGMRFEHIAWLTKHLCRIHKENSQAKNLAEAFERLKPNNRKKMTIPKYVQNANILPIYQDVFKQTNVAANRSPSSTKPSMLSTLLKKPLPNVNKFNTMKQTQRQSASLSRQPDISNYLVSPKQSLNPPSQVKPKSVPTCNVCGYKTRWLSELERHMRVHKQDKPFQCPKCKYHCKWKGDLNRHMMKYHGIKVPTGNKKNVIPKLKLKKSASDRTYLDDDWETVSQETGHNSLSTSGISANSEESPLDLRLSKSTFPHPYFKNNAYNPYDFESDSAVNSKNDSSEMDFPDLVKFDSTKRTSSNSSLKTSIPNSDVEETNPFIKRKYKCPFCSFSTSTASRFHVHIVQHYNKRPFMCSLCGYRSNWEWDITKHIRLKGCKDKAHTKACVLLTDETGRRNYDKYEKYLVDIDETKSKKKKTDHNFETRFSQKRNSDNASKKKCSYDFKNIASNFEPDPVNEDTTTEIDLPVSKNDLEKQDNSSIYNFTNQDYELEEKSSYKHYYCKHCNYKHSTKRVVVSHLSVHAGLKPFRCRACGIASNWRHVIVKHVKDIHNGIMSNVEDRIRFAQEGHGIRLTSVNTAGSRDNNVLQKSSARFKCNICPYTCDKEYYIKFHLKQHKQREGAIYECPACPYFVKFKKSLTKHVKLHGYSNLPSNVLSENMNAQQNGSYYTDIPLEENNFDSQFSELGGNSASISFNQLADDQTSKVKRHVCKHCPYRTDNKTQFLYHKQFHRPNPSAPFKCNTCSYWATMQHLLTQHMKIHCNVDVGVQDDNLKKKYSSYYGANSYTDVPASSSEPISVVYVKRGDFVLKMFKCNHCPMMNKKRANVRVHQRMHGVIVKNGKFACSFCNYQCLNQGGLTNHLKIHRKKKEKNYSNRIEANLNLVPEGGSSSEELLLLKKHGFNYLCPSCPAIFKSSSDYNIHQKFHGSNLPFPCPHCDYRARHRPHLSKHLQVHAEEYRLKRVTFQPMSPPPDPENKTEFTDTAGLKNVAGRKKIDQMLLLEATEAKASLKITEDCITKLHKCVFCPASFFKTSTLAYHISLHGSEGEFKCTVCDYSTTRTDNLDIHTKIHPEVKKVTIKRAPTVKAFPCPKCPAIFYKQDRFNRHFDLHGKNSRFVCEHCDYSVLYAANLIKHRKVHLNPPSPVVPQNSLTSSLVESNEPDISMSIHDSTTSATSSLYAKALNEGIKAESDEKKTYYICDRCPYAQHRKDAVQSHQRRHWLLDGVPCLYCDYSSMNSAKLRDHVKLHVQHAELFPAQAFMKYEKFEIWCKGDDGEDIVLFEDKFLDSDSNEENISEIGHTRTQNARLETSKAFGKMNETQNLKNLSKHVSLSTESAHTPVVVLSDIFTTDKDLKRWVPEGNFSSLRKKLKIKNLLTLPSISNGDSSKENSTNVLITDEEKKLHERPLNKPNIVVKIKVGNCLKDNREKTTYSVSKNEIEQAASDVGISDDESSENVQPELQVTDNSANNSKSEDIEKMSEDIEKMSEDVEKMSEEIIPTIELANTSNEQVECGKSEEESISYEHKTDIPLITVNDIRPECKETLKLQNNIDSLTNGDTYTNLSNSINLLSDDV